jgi:zinc protease
MANGHNIMTTFSLTNHLEQSTKHGVTTMSVRTHDDATVAIISIPAGSVCDMNHGGIVALLTARMLDQGTLLHTKEEINNRLEGMGASVSFDISATRCRCVIAGMADDIEDIIALVGDMMREPRFDKHDFTIMKQRLITDITTDYDNPRTVARTLLTGTLFLEGHPFHEYPLETCIRFVEGATVNDIKSFHSAFFGVGDVAVVCIGKVSHAHLADACAEAFGHTETRMVSPCIAPVPENKKRRTSVHAHMAKRESSAVYMGGLLPLAPLDPVYDAFVCGLNILGGGMFANRLNREVREKRGLTYHIRTYIGGYDGPLTGYWVAHAMFPPRSYKEGVKVMLAEMEAIVSRGVTKRELTEKKEELLGRFATGFDDRQGMAGTLMSLYEQGLPFEHLDTYEHRVRAFTVLRVNDALKTYLRPDTAVVASAGDHTS